MLDRLIDLLVSWLRAFQFWAIVREFERGVVLRLGKFHREVGPGFHFILPAYIDDVLVDNVVPRTLNLGAQSLISLDGVQVVVASVITARIHDIRKALLEVENVDDAVQDACYAEIAGVVQRHSWNELAHPDIVEEMQRACRRRAFAYGVEIMRTQISDLTRCKTLRLIQAG